MTRRRRLGIATVLAGMAMAGATPAGAHGIGGRTDLPLTAWQLAWAAGFAVASSFVALGAFWSCLLYTSPSPRDGLLSRMPSSA